MLRLLRNISIAVLLLLPVSMAAQTIYYVTYTGNPETGGWQKVTSLAEAFDKAMSGDEIWIQGSDNVKMAYRIKQGLTVKSGVRVYGGFKGNETSIGQREYDGKKQYRLKYRSLIIQDSHINHALTMDLDPSKSGNNNTLPTIVNGLSLSNNWPQDNGNTFAEKGGGIFVTGDNSQGGAFRIEQCCILESRAMYGGGIYVDSSVQTTAAGENLIDRCDVFNNMAGSSDTHTNNGGGVFIAGAATMVNSVVFNNVNGGVKATDKTGTTDKAKIISCTVTRNSGSGIDGLGIPVYNTVIWGNAIFTTSNDTRPDLMNCAFSRVTQADMRGNNTDLSFRNRDTDGPNFVSPSFKRGYDTYFDLLKENLYPYWDWEPTDGTILVDRGANDHYDISRYGSIDMSSDPRIYNSTIDIGAYEYVSVAASRIRYVKADGKGRGTSWDDASNDLQAMIDELAGNGGGEVWVAKGTYSPKVPLVSSQPYTAAFRMRDGVSVYGGFAGEETDKADRKKKPNGMPWDFANETTLQGASYIGNVTWGADELSISSDSRHVVWFAPFQTEGDFSTLTRLDGFTVRGGNAQGGNGEAEFLTDRGGGIYMKGENVLVENCIIKENAAMRHGGGVYMADGACLRASLVYNNNAGNDGGAAYVERSGLVHRCMLANNYGDNGAGVYMNADAASPAAITASTNVITNNTARNNGAVYCNKGGVLQNNTIANNYCPKSVDAAYAYTSQTGGVYINDYALMINSVLWNNRFGNTEDPTDVPLYAKNPKNTNVRLYNNAISGADNAIWNDITQEKTVLLSGNNQKEAAEFHSGPAFSTGTGVMTSNDVLKTTYGVQQTWTTIDYYWSLQNGSPLWTAGLPLPQFPPEVRLVPELDIKGVLFAQKPTIGAFHGDNIDIKYDDATESDRLIVYVAYDHTSTEDNGSSWEHPYRSINNAIDYLSNLSQQEVNGRTLEIRVMEGDLAPRYTYMDEDRRSATMLFRKTESGAKLRLVGGWYLDADGKVKRAPMEHRTILNGNPDGKALEEGLYHVVTVGEGADIELDGIHIVNGNLSSDAVIQRGAGLLAYDNATVMLLNCTIEDNTAITGAAIYAPSTTSVIMRNCVVNNNTCSDSSKPIIAAGTLTMEHVTIVNNIGLATVSGNSSFAAGNTSGNTLTGVATVGGTGDGKGGQLNFANPTNDVGAKLGFDTYLGGYTVFRPLTSSNNVADIINKATGTSSVNTDITTVNDRDLGGAPDLGAYEAELPKKGRIYYVRTNGSDSNDGLSWDKAFATISKAVETAKNGAVIDGEKPQVWVAAGTYKANPNNEGNCFVIEDGVNVFGAFPASGNPGLNERHPLCAQSVGSNDYGIYETILTSDSGNSRRILGSADRYNPDPDNKVKATFQYETTWDGFTITGGDLNKESGRDGGAGARLFEKMNLKDCVVTGNNTYASNNHDYADARGGGIFCDEGSIVNCYLINNTMKAKNHSKGAFYGGGAYLYRGTMYNCVVANNQITATFADGAGLFLENATFYNNTVVNNTATGTARTSGGITVWNDGKGGILNLYNCIIAGNNGYNQGTVNPVYGNQNIAAQKGTIGFNNSLLDTNTNNVTYKNGDVKINYNEYCLNYTANGTKWTDIFNTVNTAAFSQSDYRLNGLYPSTLNMGQDIIGSVNLAEYTDMDFTDRIKDCRVDAGAYEFRNIVGTTPEETTTENGSKKAVYYVTQNGKATGNMSGSSLANAACATKLQTVLDAAGDYAKNNPATEVIVKVAGYANTNWESTPYHATKLADENDPQSYSYTVPYGVTLMGGYNELAADWNDSATKKEDANGNVIRDVMSFPTVLSPIKQATATTQEIKGYHTVTFGEKPADWTGKDKKTIIDGVYLEGGSATSLAGEGNKNTQGGGAIVPAWAHVRNCVIQNNEAMYGGGLYVLPGGMVSGCAILHNTANKTGGGLYASAKDMTEGYPAYIISNTIADNEAQIAGGVYSEKGAAMFVNDVIFGNEAGSDKNISADLNSTTAKLFEDIYQKKDGEPEITKWYPFNQCYVESVELHGNFLNQLMVNDKTVYFNDDDSYTPKPYSQLISHGMTTFLQKKLEEELGLAAYDMRGVQRVDSEDGNTPIDCGAYAVIDTKITDKLVKRLFVSRGHNEIVSDGTYIGQSFKTPFTWLGDALQYIKDVRTGTDAIATEAKATTFEIFVASGTYKPRRKRSDAHTESEGATDQRQNSFVIPYNVKIYGGFSGEEEYYSHEVGGSYNPTGVDVSTENDITDYSPNQIKKDILDKRKYSDYNGNDILEPWEMANGTILSGAIDLVGTEQHVYHVLYSDKGSDVTGEQSVTLDGLTVMNGKTKDFLHSETDTNEEYSEVGRGAGLYSNGVDYTIVNCRFMENEAVRGGGIYVRNGNLTSINSVFAGCSAMEDKDKKPAGGGGVYMAVIGTETGKGAFRAVNTLFVNNTSAGTGGAIQVEGGSVNLMNNTIVSNETATGPVINSENGKEMKMVNTLLWNNKSGDNSGGTISGNVDITYSASDIDYNGMFAADNGTHNYKLVADNMDLSGPRFSNPNLQVGAKNYNPVSNWNPIAQSPLTDSGSGKVKSDATDYTSDASYVTGDPQAYRDWFKKYAEEYINNYMGDPTYLRYSGPLKEDGTADNRPIDIGLYEYQYLLDFSKMDAIYVDVVSRGQGNGQNWMNATDDLRGAIIGAANPTSNTKETRRVFVKAGEYVDPLVALGSTYTLHTSDKENLRWKKLEIYGSCTGTTIKYKEQETQDFSMPTVIHNYPNPNVNADNLLSISSDKKVLLSGITFINDTGNGIYVSSNSGLLTLKHVAIRACTRDGMTFNQNSGKALFVNTLFADNTGNGLNVGSTSAANITLVNTTFVQNGTDMSQSLTDVYNSTSWNNGTQNMKETDGHNNKVFAANTKNDDLDNGPRFRDPSNGDYRIRPNFTLLNKGSEELYTEHTGITDMSKEKDLYNVARVVDNIDIGAYEFEAVMQPIIYVKPGLLNSDKSGKDWDNAIDDLQDAVDLAGMYVGEAYVFVHHTQKDKDAALQVKYNGVKVYGGMNDESSAYTETADIVKELLDKRVGLLERDSHSELGALTISEGSVVDGFEVTGSPVIENGMLSTSIVNGEVTGKADGILYNTLLKGNVSGVKTVNVTATGSIGINTGNNRQNVTEPNKYITSDDGWNYQLNETAIEDIDKGNLSDISIYMTMAGHDRDIAGNKRIRNKVDNGCFETWNITKEMTADNEITEEDYPHGKSVVYVRNDAELLLKKDYTDATPFNPSFLLLEHHAGLRANNKAVSLTHFAVERNIGTLGKDMAVMPFEVTKVEGTATLSLYDAATRAGYSYQYNETDGAWKNTSYNASRTPITTGWLLEGTADSKARFYGESYVENVDAGKNIELVKNNFNEPWASPSAGGNKFTHKENMSWNLFGSPYLCAMNYSDMEYGRVMYGYQNGAYTTLNTIDNTVGGYIPAGDAVFTQTATLREKEIIAVKRPTKGNTKSGEAYQGSKDMTIALSRAYTRAEESGAEDRMQLKAVPVEESRNDFAINGDGVKWMSADSIPQIYALQGKGRYSLLSAVSIEGEVNVGVTLPEAGIYTLAIPEDCDTEAYETVILKDNETGKTVDLLEGNYDFSATEAGDVEGRFTVSFNRQLDDKMGNDLRVWCPSRNQVCLQGTESGDVITVYSASGIVIANRIASSSMETISATIQGVAIVEVRRNGQTMVRKIRD